MRHLFARYEKEDKATVVPKNERPTPTLQLKINHVVLANKRLLMNLRPLPQSLHTQTRASSTI
jgi:hypothetical protein